MPLLRRTRRRKRRNSIRKSRDFQIRPSKFRGRVVQPNVPTINVVVDMVAPQRRIAKIIFALLSYEHCRKNRRLFYVRKEPGLFSSSASMRPYVPPLRLREEKGREENLEIL